MRKLESDSDDEMEAGSRFRHQSRNVPAPAAVSAPPTEVKLQTPPVQQAERVPVMSGDESDDDESADEETAEGEAESPLDALSRHHQNVERLTAETVQHALSALRDHRVAWEMHRRTFHARHSTVDGIDPAHLEAVDVAAIERQVDEMRARAVGLREELRHASKAHAMQQQRHKQEEDRLVDEINHLRRIANARK